MRLRAGLKYLCVALACAGLAGCQHLPEGVKVDLQNRVVEVGPCRCRLPDKAKPAEVAPIAEPAAEPAAEPPANEPR
jgi:hypothetical protein